MRDVLNTDIAWITSGSISSDRTHVEEISVSSIMSLFPWAGCFVSIKVPGSHILKACQRATSGLPLDYGYFSHVSGMSFKYTASKEPGNRVDVGSVTIGGVPIDPHKQYTMATTQFIAEGGDGFDMFAKGTTTIVSAEHGMLIIPTIVSYIKTKCHGTIELKCDGRLSAV